MKMYIIALFYLYGAYLLICNMQQLRHYTKKWCLCPIFCEIAQQQIFCLHFVLSSASFYVTSTTAMSFLTALVEVTKDDADDY